MNIVQIEPIKPSNKPLPPSTVPRAMGKQPSPPGEKKVVLIYPDIRVKTTIVPLAMVHLGAYCEKHGWTVRVLDTRFDDPTPEVFEGATAVGISAMTGTQIGRGLEVCAWIRDRFPDLPLIWGGLHVTLSPEQSLQHPLVDYVVHGEGEAPLVYLLECLANNRRPERDRGVLFPELDGTIPPPGTEQIISMDDIETMGYHLLNRRGYPSLAEGLSYQTSRGCPQRCSFCYIQGINRKKWRFRSSKLIVDDLVTLNQTYGTTNFYFVDDQMFVHEPRMVELCRMLPETGIPFQWNSSSTIETLARYKPESLEAVKASGCTYIRFGGESGSSEILDSLHKKWTRSHLDVVLAGLEKYDIKGVFNFMIGFPDETEEDVWETFKVIDYILSHKNTAIKTIWKLMPFPGTEVWDRAVAMGYPAPQTLEEWDGYGFTNMPRIPWLTARQERLYEVIMAISRNSLSSFGGYRWPRTWKEALSHLLLLDARLRWRFKFFIAPIEWHWRNLYIKRKYGMGTV